MTIESTFDIGDIVYLGKERKTIDVISCVCTPEKLATVPVKVEWRYRLRGDDFITYTEDQFTTLASFRDQLICEAEDISREIYSKENKINSTN